MMAALVVSLIGCEVRYIPEESSSIWTFKKPEHQMIYVHGEYCYEEWKDIDECFYTYCYDGYFKSWYVYDIECY